MSQVALACIWYRPRRGAVEPYFAEREIGSAGGPFRANLALMSDPHAQHMRRNATKAEWVLWCKLRDLRALGFHIRRQAPLGPYILDFVPHRERLVVELDGDQHGQPVQRAHDEKRTKSLERDGYQILRYGNRDVLKNLDGVLECILAELQKRSRMKFGGAVPPPEPISR